MFNNEQKSAWGLHPMHESYFIDLASQLSEPWLARVTFQSHELYRVLSIGSENERWAKVRGSLIGENEGFPIVGDWVVLSHGLGDHQHYPIEAVLPRRMILRRGGSPKGTESLFANVEHVALITSFNHDFNLRRLERGVGMVESGGGKARIVVNKSDLLKSADRAELLEGVKQRFPYVPVYECSGLSGEGVKNWVDGISPGETLAVLGMSGVGKSTLLNHLLGGEAFAYGEIREDDSRGRHTTTHRSLVRTSFGFWVLDSPGIRAFGIDGDEKTLGSSFEDIATLFLQCRFGNCRHQGDTGCAIERALEEGNLDPDRWENFLKIQSEMKFHERKGDKRQMSEYKKERVRLSKSLRQIKKMGGPG